MPQAVAQPTTSIAAPAASATGEELTRPVKGKRRTDAVRIFMAIYAVFGDRLRMLKRMTMLSVDTLCLTKLRRQDVLYRLKLCKSNCSPKPLIGHLYKMGRPHI